MEKDKGMGAASAGGRISWLRLLQMGPVCLLLLCFFVVPMARTLWGSLDGAELSLGHYEEAVTNPLYAWSLLRTFTVGVGVTLLCVVLGYPVAFLMTTLERRGAAVMSLLVMIPLFTAFLIRTYAWMVLLGRAGALNKTLLWLGVIDAPLKVLGTSMAVHIGMVHALLPLAVFTMYASMSQIDRSLMVAAQVNGATPLRAFARVYLPLSMPGVVSAMVLVFIMAIGFYVTPVLIGGPGDTMISQLIVTQMTSLLNLELGYALSILLLLVTLVVLALSSLVVPIEQMWALQDGGGRAGRGRRWAAPLRRLLAKAERLASAVIARVPWRAHTGLGVYAGLVVLFLFLPILVVAFLSFSSSPFLVFPPPGFSLRWYEAFFSSETWIAALWMSLRLGLTVGGLAAIIGAACAFAIVRGDFAAKRAIFLLTLSPILVPVIVLSISLFTAMSGIGLLGTFPGLVIGHLVMAVPYALVVMIAAVKGLDRNLEYAAATHGAGPWRVLRKVVVPLLAPALITGGVMAFLVSFDELLVSIFLLGRQPQTLPIKMWTDIRIQIDPTISAASTVLVLSVSIIMLAANFRAIFPRRGERAE